MTRKEIEQQIQDILDGDTEGLTIKDFMPGGYYDPIPWDIEDFIEKKKNENKKKDE